MAPPRQRHAIFISEQIARDVQIAAVVASGQTDLGRGIRSGTAADHHGTDRKPGQKAGNAGCRGAWRRLSRKKVASTRKPEARGIQEGRRKNVCLLKIEDLLAESKNIRAIGI